MEDLERISAEIGKRADKLQALEKELEEKKKLYAEGIERFSKLAVIHAGKSRMPGSVHAEKRLLAESRLESEALEDAVAFLKNEITELEKRKTATLFVEKQGRRYGSAKQACEEAVIRLGQAGVDLRELSRTLKEATGRLVGNTQEMAFAFHSLYTLLESKFSLKEALDGKLKEIQEPEDRDSIAGEVGRKMKSFACLDEMISTDELEDMKHAVKALEGWKVLISSVQGDLELPLSRRSLMPKESDMASLNQKYAPTPARYFKVPYREVVTRIKVDRKQPAQQ